MKTKTTLKTIITGIVAGILSMNIHAQSFTENFDDITTLPGSGWVQTNKSNPVGTTGWSQGATIVFNAFNGAANAYISANYNNTGTTGTISNWLLAPNVTLRNGDVFSFYTNKATPDTYPDRLQLWMSTNGASTFLGPNEF